MVSREQVDQEVSREQRVGQGGGGEGTGGWSSRWCPKSSGLTRRWCPGNRGGERGGGGGGGGLDQEMVSRNKGLDQEVGTGGRTGYRWPFVCMNIGITAMHHTDTLRHVKLNQLPDVQLSILSERPSSLHRHM